MSLRMHHNFLDLLGILGGVGGGGGGTKDRDIFACDVTVAAQMLAMISL